MGGLPPRRPSLPRPAAADEPGALSVGRIVPIYFELSYGGMTRAELDPAICWAYYLDKPRR